MDDTLYKGPNFFLNQWNRKEDSSIQKSTHIVSTVTHSTRKVNNFSLILLRLAMRPKGLHIKKKHLWMKYLLNNNMLVVVYLISNVHVQKDLPIFQDPIPIDRGLPVREAMPHKLNINQHTTKPMLVNVLFCFWKRLCTD